MKKLTQEELNGLLVKHESWLEKLQSCSTLSDDGRLVLEGVDLTGLSFVGHSIASARISSCKCVCADFSGVDISKADVSDTDFSSADLWGANMDSIDVSYCNFNHAGLSHVDARDAIFINSNFREANLSLSDLYDTLLRNADFTSANLAYANLTNAYMPNVILEDTRLYNTTGNGKEVKTIQTERYTINMTKDAIQIGCKRYTPEQWKNFDDDTINDMDSGYHALNWWKENKEFVLNTHNHLFK